LASGCQHDNLPTNKKGILNKKQLKNLMDASLATIIKVNTLEDKNMMPVEIEHTYGKGTSYS
jgi:hypothetical protein